MSQQPRPTHARMLLQARKRLQLTGAEMANKLKVSEAAYRNAENGRYGNTVFENLESVMSAAEAEEIRREWQTFRQSSTPQPADEIPGNTNILMPMELLHGLAEARVTRFHPSRKYYKLLREGRHTISAYVAQAQTSLEMVSIFLATGLELENVLDTFETLLAARTSVTVSLLDPECEHLMLTIADVISSTPKTLAMRISDTFDNLERFRSERLSPQASRRFEVRAHRSLPNASAIIIDGDQSTGLIQLETKGYKMGMDKSFGFEVAAPSEFFTDLRESYRHLMRDGPKSIRRMAWQSNIARAYYFIARRPIRSSRS